MTPRLDLPAKTERVLRHLRDRALKVEDLGKRAGVSRATAFRLVEQLTAAGLVSTTAEGVKELTSDGRAWLESRDGRVDIEPELPIPALEHLPGPRHRIATELGLCAAVVRTHRLADCSLASIVIVGAPRTYKTTAGDALCVMSGGGKTTNVTTAKENHILARRDNKGDVVKRCALLDERVAVLDELDKIQDSGAKNAIEQVYMHGLQTVTTADGIALDVRCTTVAVMNPVGPFGSTFEQRTGLHSSLERRVVLVDLEGWRPPEELEGVDIRKSLRDADATRTEKLPVPRNPQLNVAKRFMKTIRPLVVDPASLEPVDGMLWSLLAVGSTAWFGTDEEAFRFIVWRWAHLAAARKLLRADWQSCLREHFAPKLSAEEAARRKRERAVASLTSAIDTQMKGNLALAEKILFDPRYRSLRVRIRRELNEDFESVQRFIDLGLWLEREGVTLQTVKALAAEAKHDDVAAHPTGARYLLALGDVMYRKGSRIANWADPFLPQNLPG